MNERAYWEKRLRERGGLTGVASVDHSAAYNEWVYRVRGRVFARTIRSLELDRRDLRVLDVGSGTGFYIKRWRALGVDGVVGSDFSRVAVERMRRDLPGVTIHHLDIAASDPAALGPFDAISAIDVLFHILGDDRYETALRNVAAMLAPGGFFVFSEHAPRNRAEDRAHRVSRPLAEILRRLDAAGLDLVVRRPMLICMSHPVDERARLLWALWHGRLARLALGRRSGPVLGAVLFPLELLLTRALAESPTTNILVARKRR